MSYESGLHYGFQNGACFMLMQVIGSALLLLPIIFRGALRRWDDKRVADYLPSQYKAIRILSPIFAILFFLLAWQSWAGTYYLD